MHKQDREKSSGDTRSLYSPYAQKYQTNLITSS